MFGMAYWLASNHILFGTWRQAIEYPEHINRVTPEQVRDYCATYLKPDNRTTGILVSAKESK
jgi:predicted Zn-dependent peptidase